jgi:hypothetical protein
MRKDPPGSFEFAASFPAEILARVGQRLAFRTAVRRFFALVDPSASAFEIRLRELCLREVLVFFGVA